MSTLLSGDNITRTFGGLVALDDVSFRVEENEICCLIGPNGAGKTTLLNVLTGRLPADSGTVTFAGKDITGMNPDKITRNGLVKTNQIVRPFEDMNVIENIAVAGVWGDNDTKNMEEATERARELVGIVGLEEFAEISAGRLTHTPNRRLELARALATDPELILLDEAAAGLTSEELPSFLEVIEAIRDDLGITIFWIEHVMEAVMGTADRIIVLEFGEIIADGAPDEIAENERVQEAYLGGEAHA